MTYLLGCPFCGGSNISRSRGEHADGKPWFYIECDDCAAMAEPDVWNRRPLLSTDKAVGEWQPIEAYPKSEPAYDEIVLLAWGDRVVPGRWVSNAGYQGFQPLSMIARKWDEPAQPTDFMRLPKPPALTASRASKSQGGK